MQLAPARTRPEVAWPRPGAGVASAHVSRPLLALVLISVAALPLLTPYGPGHSSPADMPIAASLLAFGVWALLDQPRLHLPYAIGVGLFVVGGAIGALAGPLPVTGARTILQDLFLFGWCLAVANICRQPAILRLILQTWIASAAGWAAIMVAAYFGGLGTVAGITERTGVRAQFTFGDPNLAASYFFVAIMVVTAARWPGRVRYRGLVYTVLAVALVITGSNGGLAATVLGLGVVAIAAVKNRAGLGAAVTLCSAAVLLAGVVGFTSTLAHVQAWARQSGQPILRDSIGRGNTSTSQREELIVEGLQLYQQWAPLGSGPYTVKPILRDTLAPYANEAHDDMIEAAVERGLVGAVGLLVIAVAAASRTVAILRGALVNRYGRVVRDPSALAGAGLGLAASATFYQVQHFRHVWLLLAVIAGVHAFGLAWRARPALLP